MRDRSLAVGCVAVALLLLGWRAARFVSDWRFESGLARAKQDVASGRFTEARRWLATLPPHRTTDPEAAYWLGVCEHAAGHYEAALAAWTRVPRGSPRSTPAALARARTLVGDLGRFAEAEAILEATLRERGGLRAEVRHTLGQLYFWEFRRDAMRRLIREGWAEAPRPAAELRDLWLIDDATTVLNEVRTAVEAAARRAPEDDRVWLARAGLATQTGRFGEAERWLDACAQRRPSDPAVWRARLVWARASGNAAECRLALGHLPADMFSEAELLDLGAWLAARQGNAGIERRALERLIDQVPGDTHALERLAVMSSESGQADRAAGLRRRKAVVDRDKDHYRQLLGDRVPSDRFSELAGLAESLGRAFEARGWWLLAARYGPNGAAASAAARLGGGRNRGFPPEPGTAADRLTKLLPDGGAALVAQPVGPSTPGVDTMALDFHEDAQAVGLRFVFENGRSPLRQLPETTAGGVGLIDFDGDGWLDLYAVQGGTFPPDSHRPSTGDRLFRNRGDGTFEEATARSGIADLTRGYGHGVAVGDYDNDGHPDLFVTRWRSYALYRNRGDGRFEDVTRSVGLGGDRDWPTSAAFADLDNDGDLDLYVCHYLVWDAEHPMLCRRESPSSGHGNDHESAYSYCMPHRFPALPDHLFRNDDGRFVDVTEGAGIVDRDGRGLGVVAADVDDDGLVDMFVANDTTANYLFHNLGGMQFEEVGVVAGVACNADGAFQAGMGTACGDLDGDGRLDLAVTNFYGESTTFYRNLGGGVFGDHTAAIGLSAPSRYLLGFGIVFLDANRDGRLDLATANGHVIDDRPRFPYTMPALLLVGTPSGRLEDVSTGSGTPWQTPHVGRGLAAGDLDNDGRADLLLLAQKSPLAYFHNKTEGGRFVTFRLEGTISNRDGVGARVVITSGGRRQVAVRYGGGSFQSASDPRLHFGLGVSTRLDAVEVRWPSGRVDRFRDVPADTGYLVREGENRLQPLAGFAPGRGTRDQGDR